MLLQSCRQWEVHVKFLWCAVLFSMSRALIIRKNLDLPKSNNLTPALLVLTTKLGPYLQKP